MATLAVEHHPQAVSVPFYESSLIVELVDGRTISVPLSMFKHWPENTHFSVNLLSKTLEYKNAESRLIAQSMLLALVTL